MTDTQQISLIENVITGVFRDTSVFYNNSYSFFCPLDGDAIFSMGEESFTITGKDVVFIPPDTSCSIRTEEAIIFFSVTFNYIDVENILGYHAWESITQHFIPHTDYRCAALTQQLARIATIWLSDPGGSVLHLSSQIFAFFHYLKCCHMVSVQPSRPLHLTEKQHRNILKMTDYVRQNHTSPLTLSDVASHFHMTPQYTANFFKQALGKTFFEYLADTRLLHAFNYVSHSNETPFRIAALSGFPNLNSFVKTFSAAYGQSPDEWRQAHQSPPSGFVSGNFSPISSNELARDYINNYIPLLQTASPVVHESKTDIIHINTLNQREYLKPWSYLVNLGFIRSFSFADYRRQLEAMQQLLHFEYGRILRPFDIVMPVTVDGQKMYDFSKVFQVLDFLHQIHLKPFLELGNKLYKININSFDHVKVTEETSAADYFEDLLDILPNFIRCCINRYGAEAVSQWRFELWTDHTNAVSGNESPEIYARYFTKIYKIIKSLLPDCKIGGPGYNTYAPISHFSTIMDKLSAHGCLPDFITAYIYPYVVDPVGNENRGPFPASMISSDQNIWQHRLSSLSDFCRTRYPQISDLLITEYAADISSRNFINDSIYLATFIAKFNLDGLGYARAFAYWLISDIPLEYRDSNRILFGGNGLINRNSIYKPGFYAYRFLTDMGTRLVERGKNYLLTATQDSGHFQLLVYNYAHMHEDFCRDNTSYASLKNPTAVFEHMAPRDITFFLDGLTPGTYRLRHFAINNDWGNLLNEWIRLGSTENLSRGDIDYLASSSRPHHELSIRAIEDSMDITCRLESQSVNIFFIDRII